MSDIKIENVEKNFDHILQLVGNESFVDWTKFAHSSAEVINSIEELNRRLSLFRECQQRNYIQSMKKMKSLDLPDLIGAVKAKKLPKEALRAVLPRFKAGQAQKLELVQSVQTLKANANKQLEEYVNKNNVFLEQLKKYSNFVDEKIKESGYVPEPVEPAIKATVKFNLSQELATQIASKIKIEYIPGTKYIGFVTYTQIVRGSFQLIKEENTKLTKQARVQQRANIKDNAKYLAIMNQYLMNGQALIIEGQKLLAKKVGLTERQLEDSEVFMIQNGLGGQLMMVQSQLRAQVKQSMPPAQDVAYEVAKQVISFQTTMLGEKQDYIKSVLDGLEKTQQTIQTIPMLLALMLNDMVFEKYGYEEQDFMKNVSEEVIANKPQLGKIFSDMEIGIIKLMQHIGVVTPEAGQILEQGATQRAQMPAQIPGGMMQGMNPMQMLQMQQMQQMQQMKSAKQPPV